MSLPLTVVVLVALFSPLATPTAHACSCLAADEESFVEGVLLHSPLVLVGTIASTDSQFTQIDVETIYKGELIARVTADQTQKDVELQRESASKHGYPGLLVTGPGDCSMTLLGQPGQRYLLGLAESNIMRGAYRGNLCATMAEVPDNEYWSWHRLIRSLSDASGGGLTPDGLPALGGMPGSATFPTLPAAVAATLGSLAFLLGASFVRRRRAGGG